MIRRAFFLMTAETYSPLTDGRRKGFALVMTLVVTAVSVVFSAASMGRMVSELNNTQRAHRSNLALHVAESGVEEAIWEINHNNGTFDSADGWTGTNPKVKTASLTTSTGTNLGSYTVTVTDPAGASPVIQSVGRALHQSALAETRIVRVVLDAGGSPVFTRAAFADVELHMDSNACTDSFDSSLGDYDGPNTSPASPKPHNNYGSQGDIGTNATASGAISLDSNADVYGDAEVGVGGNPSTAISLSGSASISGAESALTGSVTIPSVSAPTGLTNVGSVDYDDDDAHTIVSSGQYTDFTIDGNTSVTIDGNVTIYVSDDFHMDSNSELIITNGSRVEIYVGGSINVSSNADINNVSRNASMLAFYGTDDLVDNGSDPGIQFNSNTNIYATILAPNSTVDFDSNAELFGAVIADKVILNSNTCIHYDEALGDGSSSGSDVSVEVWQEK